MFAGSILFRICFLRFFFAGVLQARTLSRRRFSGPQWQSGRATAASGRATAASGGRTATSGKYGGEWYRKDSSGERWFWIAGQRQPQSRRTAAAVAAQTAAADGSGLASASTSAPTAPAVAAQTAAADGSGPSTSTSAAAAQTAAAVAAQTAAEDAEGPVFDVDCFQELRMLACELQAAQCCPEVVSAAAGERAQRRRQEVLQDAPRVSARDRQGQGHGLRIQRKRVE